MATFGSTRNTVVRDFSDFKKGDLFSVENIVADAFGSHRQFINIRGVYHCGACNSIFAYIRDSSGVTYYRCPDSNHMRNLNKFSNRREL